MNKKLLILRFFYRKYKASIYLILGAIKSPLNGIHPVRVFTLRSELVESRKIKNVEFDEVFTAMDLRELIIIEKAGIVSLTKKGNQVLIDDQLILLSTLYVIESFFKRKMIALLSFTAIIISIIAIGAKS